MESCGRLATVCWTVDNTLNISMMLNKILIQWFWSMLLQKLEYFDDGKWKYYLLTLSRCYYLSLRVNPYSKCSSSWNNKQWYHCREWQKKVYDWIKSYCKMCFFIGSIFLFFSSLSSILVYHFLQHAKVSNRPRWQSGLRSYLIKQDYVNETRTKQQRNRHAAIPKNLNKNFYEYVDFVVRC